jgi:hypothetical protein
MAWVALELARRDCTGETNAPGGGASGLLTWPAWDGASGAKSDHEATEGVMDGLWIDCLARQVAESGTRRRGLARLGVGRAGAGSG